MTCGTVTSQLGCFNGQTVTILYTIGTNKTDGLWQKTAIVDAAGTIVAGADASNTTIGACQIKMPRPHVFKNVNIPTGQSFWVVPITATSPVSQFQVTVRNALGSDISVRVLVINSTEFSIDAAVASNNVNIFVEPIETLS
jgi:hypothetical protein